MDHSPGSEAEPAIEADVPAFDEIDFNRWYVLGANENAYAVWRKGRAEPIATFPRHDAGYASAEALFEELSRTTWLNSPWWARALVVMLSLGVVGLVGGGIAAAIAQRLLQPNDFGRISRFVEELARDAALAQEIGLDLTIGSLAVLVAVYLMRRLFGHDKGAPAGAAPSTEAGAS